MNVNAYDQLSRPTPLGAAIKAVIVGMFCTLSGGCILGMMFSESNDGGSGNFIAVGGAFVLLVLSVLGVFLKYRSDVEKYNKQIAIQAEYWKNLDQILKETVESRGQWLIQRDWSTYFGLYRPKKEETIYWMGPAAMSEQREKVDTVARVGVVKLGALPFNTLGYANVEKVVKTMVSYEHVEGRGVLVITDKRLIFVSNGHGSNWSQPWAELMSWQPAINAVLVQPSQGQPKAFLLEGAGYQPLCDTQVTTTAMEFAHDS